MNQSPCCSIIILSYNQIEYTLQCLDSIRTYTENVSYEIIVIDNASSRETVACLEEREDIILVKNEENKGFAGGCNQGIELAKGQFIMLLNNDVIVTHNWLFNMVQFLEEHNNVSMVGPLTNATVGKQMIEVNYGENLVNMQLFAKGIAEGNQKPWKTLRLVAFCVLIRRSLFDEIGMLDTRFATGNYEDDDFNIRALCAKKSAYICRNSFIHHFMNISFKQKNIQRERIMMENKIRLEDKWDNLNWNHHAVFNQYMLNKALEQRGKNILHLGCGLGALAIELKDAASGYKIIGSDPHPIRLKIAEQFIDETIKFEQLDQYLQNTEQTFDVIIIEGVLEILGIDFLNSIKRILKKDGILLLRVFNSGHITTMEQLITGSIEGRLLCASSKEFQFFYDKSLSQKLEAFNYQIVEEKCIIKSFSNIQNSIYERIKDLLENIEEPRIYNRIYCLIQRGE